MAKEVDLSVKQTGDRNSTRSQVIMAFLKEQPGTGTGELTSAYRYNVETLQGGRQIFLTRPARNKLGFDFLIHLEGEKFQNGRDNPAHDDIKNDLATKARENPKFYPKLHKALCRVHACEDPEDIIPEYKDLKFKSGLSIEAILKIIKWFFIEQDIRFWNYSGRNMFKDKVLDPIADSVSG